MTETRVLPLSGIHNFRDYGLYPVAGGGRVRAGLLWRSAQHGDATDADLDTVKGLGIGTVVDLRGNSERDANPCRRYPGFAAEVLFHDGETAGLHVQAAASNPSATEARAAMQRLYEGIAYRPTLTPMISCYFNVLRQRDDASLVHCVAGKDRTGFAVALLHHVLGVHADDIMADYLLTNVAGNIDRRIAAGAEQIRARYGAIDEATIRTLMGVEPEYLDTAFQAIRASHGSVDAYLADVIGLDDAAQGQLRERFVAD
ncbi:tyrosine-protein phosphatase [Novosphingobium sp.]|uniref:tyrosine-protein phosphatase n=1 Tax=Novosphingobium sp. TaxID=1874826 RepID=UPI0027362310|nr:tyrosine-protein phosphatase [Novosphingobium sp.]MDP3907081.1 tyrosine-protein phosphatase [Novosphingobium sp.]